jgi:hypothetical protein
MGHTTIHGTELRCLHCGDTYSVNPGPINQWIAAMRTFDDDHKLCKPSAAGEARMKWATPEEWWRSWDTGESSKTIWRVMMGQRVVPEAVPHDPSDFGRCHRLLAAFPEWRARLSEMRKVRGWSALVDAWPKLEALFVEESPSGQCPKLFAAIQTCVREEASP